MTTAQQTYRVLCVTMKPRAGTPLCHVQETGTAEVLVVERVVLGVRIVETVVRFHGEEYKLLYVRSGISGIAVTLGVQVDEGVWELYTDTPTNDTKHSSFDVRKAADFDIERSARWR